MIIREYFKTRNDGVRLFRTYSDQGYIIKEVETGIKCIDAVYVESVNYTYVETDEKIISEGEQDV